MHYRKVSATFSRSLKCSNFQGKCKNAIFSRTVFANEKTHLGPTLNTCKIGAWRAALKNFHSLLFSVQRLVHVCFLALSLSLSLSSSLFPLSVSCVSFFVSLALSCSKSRKNLGSRDGFAGSSWHCRRRGSSSSRNKQQAALDMGNLPTNRHTRSFATQEHSVTCAKLWAFCSH